MFLDPSIKKLPVVFDMALLFRIFAYSLGRSVIFATKYNVLANIVVNFTKLQFLIHLFLKLPSQMFHCIYDAHEGLVSMRINT